MTGGSRWRVIALATAAPVLAIGGSCGSSSTGHSTAAITTKGPPIYLNDPGLVGVAVRPDYISFPFEDQTCRWIRDVRWRIWGGEEARGSGLLEVCSFGRCKRTPATVRLWRRRPRNCPTGS